MAGWGRPSSWDVETRKNNQVASVSKILDESCLTQTVVSGLCIKYTTHPMRTHVCSSRDSVWLFSLVDALLEQKLQQRPCMMQPRPVKGAAEIRTGVAWPRRTEHSCIRTSGLVFVCFPTSPSLDFCCAFTWNSSTQPCHSSAVVINNSSPRREENLLYYRDDSVSFRQRTRSSRRGYRLGVFTLMTRNPPAALPTHTAAAQCYKRGWIVNSYDGKRWFFTCRSMQYVHPM